MPGMSSFAEHELTPPAGHFFANTPGCCRCRMTAALSTELGYTASLALTTRRIVLVANVLLQSRPLRLIAIRRREEEVIKLVTLPLIGSVMATHPVLNVPGLP